MKGSSPELMEGRCEGFFPEQNYQHMERRATF